VDLVLRGRANDPREDRQTSGSYSSVFSPKLIPAGSWRRGWPRPLRTDRRTPVGAPSRPRLTCRNGRCKRDDCRSPPRALPARVHGVPHRSLAETPRSVAKCAGRPIDRFVSARTRIPVGLVAGRDLKYPR
jgi:hypothetical protein